MRPVCFFLLALILSSTPVHAAAKKVTVTVEAGEYDRRGTVVVFPLPFLSEPANAGLTAVSLLPFQYETNSTNASFFLTELRRGQRQTYELKFSDKPYVGGGLVGSYSGKKFTVNGARFYRPETRVGMVVYPGSLLEYQAEPGPFPRDNIKELFRRGGYLHPIRTRSGKAVLTDDFPPNHIHHHGIWWAWTKTEFDGRKPDFWNMGDGKGRVDFVALDTQWSGVVHAGFRSRQKFVDLTGAKPSEALHETWHVTAYRPFGSIDYWFFDLVSEQRCATTNALKLPQYHYGGLGLRGNWAWNGAGKVNILTADGETDRVKANTQKARWCDMWGKIDGADCGIAVLCHPSNFRAPQPMRVHPTEPFFCYAPQQGGDMEIKPGDTYVSRYRFVVHDGPPDRKELDRLWNDYAHPPVVKVTVE